MNQKHIITVIKKDEEPETFTALTVACENLGFPYHSLKMLYFPIEHKEYTIHKTKLITGTRKK